MSGLPQVQCLIVDLPARVDEMRRYLLNHGFALSPNGMAYDKDGARIAFCSSKEELQQHQTSYFDAVAFGEKVPLRSVGLSASRLAQDLYRKNPDIRIFAYGLKGESYSLMLSDAISSPSQRIAVVRIRSVQQLFQALNALSERNLGPSAPVTGARDVQLAFVFSNG